MSLTGSRGKCFAAEPRQGKQLILRVKTGQSGLAGLSSLLLHSTLDKISRKSHLPVRISPLILCPLHIPGRPAYRLVHAWPEDGQRVDGGDGRRQVGRDGLDVQEQLAALRLVDQRDPGDTDQHHETDKQSAKRDNG